MCVYVSESESGCRSAVWLQSHRLAARQASLSMEFSKKKKKLEGVCVAISFSRGSSWRSDGTQVSCIAGRFFTIWATGNICVTFLRRRTRPCEGFYWNTPIVYGHFRWKLAELPAESAL